MATQYGIRGFDVSPLEPDKIPEFITKLGSLLAQQRNEVERLQVVRTGYPQPYLALTSYIQNEIQQSNATYNERSRQLHTTLERHKQQRANNRSRIVRIYYVVEQSVLTGSVGKASVRYRSR